MDHHRTRSTEILSPQFTSLGVLVHTTHTHTSKRRRQKVKQKKKGKEKRKKKKQREKRNKPTQQQRAFLCWERKKRRSKSQISITTSTQRQCVSKRSVLSLCNIFIVRPPFSRFFFSLFLGWVGEVFASSNISERRWRGRVLSIHRNVIYTHTHTGDSRVSCQRL